MASNINERGNNKFTTSVVKALVKFLEKVYGVVGEHDLNSDGSAKNLYFQDPSMKDIFNFFPERVCIDVLYKTFEIDWYVYIFISEDSNGRHHIIALGFLNSNDTDSILWLLNVFKKHNPNWRRMKTIAAHPDIKPREVFGFFPHSLVITCFFHAFATFKRDIDKMNLGADGYVAVELFKNMYTAQNQSEFEMDYQMLLSLPEPVVTYFQETWMTKENEWRITLDYNRENIFLPLSLFLEELNNSVGVILAAENNSIEFIKKMFLIILFKKKEKSSLFMESESFLYSKFSAEYQISTALTPYAAKLVVGQLDLSLDIILDFNAYSENYTFEHLGVTVSTSAKTCTCNFFLLTLLPCRHIFAVSRSNGFCAFDESSIDYSWTAKFYQNTLTCMQGHLTGAIDIKIPEDLPSRVTLASHLFEVSQKPLLESSGAIFESRCRLLKNMIQAWKQDNEVNVQFLGVEKIPDKSVTTHSASNAECLTKGVGNSIAIPSTSRDSASVCCNVTATSQDAGPAYPYSASACCNVTVTSQDVGPAYPYSSSAYWDGSSTPQDIPSTSQETVLRDECDVQNRKKQHGGTKNLENQQGLNNSSQFGLKKSATSISKSAHISLTYIISVICSTKLSCISWLRRMGFLPSSMKCPSCNTEMASKVFVRLTDGGAWCCTKQEGKKKCPRKCSVRAGTWLESSNMSLEQLLVFCYMWINGYTRNEVISETNITPSSYVFWDKFCQRVCERSLRNCALVAESQISSCSADSPLDKWIRENEDEDIFIKFLRDCARLHEEEKSSNGPRGQ